MYFSPCPSPCQIWTRRCWMSPHILAPDSRLRTAMWKGDVTPALKYFHGWRKSSGLLRGEGAFVSAGLGEVQLVLWLQITKGSGCPVTHPRWCWSPSSPMHSYLCAAAADSVHRGAEVWASRRSWAVLSPCCNKAEINWQENLPLCYLNMSFAPFFSPISSMVNRAFWKCD